MDSSRIVNRLGGLSAVLVLAGIGVLAVSSASSADPSADPSVGVSQSSVDRTSTPQAMSEPSASSTVDAAGEEADSPTLTVDVSADKTSVHAGDTVTYTITVTNVHPTATIQDVVVRSPDVRDCDRDLGDLTPKKVVTYTCSAPAPASTFKVRVRVRGYDSSGNLISRHDNHVTIEVLPTGGSGKTSSPSDTESSTSLATTPNGDTGNNGSSLAVTGTTAAVLATIGVLLLAAGAGLWFLARRRRVEV